MNGIKSLAICSNDVKNYPEDSFENMIQFSHNHKFNFPYLFDKMIKFHENHNFNFPYLLDETQVVAKDYGAVCTPDFFGYNKNLKLQYRGRIRELKNLNPIKSGESDLFNAMKKISETGRGPEEQTPSMGCGIKWLDN